MCVLEVLLCIVTHVQVYTTGRKKYPDMTWFYSPSWKPHCPLGKSLCSEIFLFGNWFYMYWNISCALTHVYTFIYLQETLMFSNDSNVFWNDHNCSSICIFCYLYSTIMIFNKTNDHIILFNNCISNIFVQIVIWQNIFNENYYIIWIWI